MNARAESFVLQERDEDRVVAEAAGRGRTVLDCGCGYGRIAKRLAELECRVDGIELAPEAALQARAVCRQVVQGSLTDPNAWAELGDRTYDAIVFCHVLEHLTDPRSVLAIARARLAPGGHFVIVLPNVAGWRTRWQLLRGRWEYADEGICDRTHVKFYTLKTAREFLAEVGLKVSRTELLTLRPTGNPLRRLVVRGVRELVPLASVSAFLFVAAPEARAR